MKDLRIVEFLPATEVAGYSHSVQEVGDSVCLIHAFSSRMSGSI
jgi:hypothetical protein